MLVSADGLDSDETDKLLLARQIQYYWVCTWTADATTLQLSTSANTSASRLSLLQVKLLNITVLGARWDSVLDAPGVN